MRCGVLVLLAACGRATVAPAPTYREASATPVTREYAFAVHPLHNPRRLDEMFGPLTEHLARRTGLHLRLEASRSYEAFDAKLRERRVDLALPNPFQTVRSLEHGYRVIAKMGDDQEFRGIVLVRRDGPKEAADLVGKRVAFPAPTALAATMMPQLYLQGLGLRPGRDYEAVYVGSQDSAIMSVFLGRVAAAATWPPPWRALSKQRPELARELVVRWETGSLLNNAVIARDDVPSQVARAFGDALTHLHDEDEGRALLQRLELSRFEGATDQTYQPVREFLLRYERDVGALP